jgi:hypothetical protein
MMPARRHDPETIRRLHDLNAEMAVLIVRHDRSEKSHSHRIGPSTENLEPTQSSSLARRVAGEQTETREDEVAPEGPGQALQSQAAGLDESEGDKSVSLVDVELQLGTAEGSQLLLRPRPNHRERPVEMRLDREVMSPEEMEGQN